MYAETSRHHHSTVGELLVRPEYQPLTELIDSLAQATQNSPEAIADNLCLIAGIAVLTANRSDDEPLTLEPSLPPIPPQYAYNKLLTLIGATGESPHLEPRHEAFSKLFIRVLDFEGSIAYAQIHGRLTRVALYKSLAQRGEQLEPHELQEIANIDHLTLALARLAAKDPGDQPPKRGLAGLFLTLDKPPLASTA